MIVYKLHPQDPTRSLFDPWEITVSLPPAALFDFDFFEPLPIQIEVSDAPLTSDAGLLPLRQFDERIGLTKQFAAALDDPRDPDLIEHTFLEMVRSRVFGILAGYEDQNDHDTLRTDPVFKLIADRSPEDDDLASQPTLSRFENQIDIASLKRLRQVFVDQFIASFAQPPLSLTFDLDAVDDPTHDVLADALVGGQQPEVLVHPSGLRVVVAGADVGVAADALGLVADHHRQLAVRLQADQPVDHVAAGVLELAGPRMLACSSKRALISTSTSTCLPASAASMSASMIGESPDVRYSVCLIASTCGSAAACSMNRCTRVANESYGWCSRTSRRGSALKMSTGLGGLHLGEVGVRRGMKAGYFSSARSRSAMPCRPVRSSGPGSRNTSAGVDVELGDEQLEHVLVDRTPRPRGAPATRSGGAAAPSRAP